MHFWYVLPYYIWIWLIAWKPRVHTTHGGLWKYYKKKTDLPTWAPPYSLPPAPCPWIDRVPISSGFGNQTSPWTTLPNTMFWLLRKEKNLEFCLLSVIGFGKKIRSNLSVPKSKLGSYWASIPYNIIGITLKAAYLKKDNCAQKLQIYLIS